MMSTATLLWLSEEQFKLDKELLDASRDRRRSGNSVVYELLVKGANPKNLEKRIPGEVSVSPLHYAARHGWYDIVQQFIEKYKCNPVIRDNKLQTPLHYACQNGCIHIAVLLIETYKCDPMVQDSEMCTPLHYACHNGHVDIAKLLIEKYKCDVNCQSKSGLTPLQKTHSISSKVIQILIQNKANAKVVDNDGNTLLHKACHDHLDHHEYSSDRYVQSVKVLLEEGKCDPNIKNNVGLAPIHLLSLRSSDIVRELVQHGANPNICDNDGNTPLHKACCHCKYSSDPYIIQSIIFFLEEGKCDPNIKNKAGLTPIQVTYPRSSEIIKELVQHGANPNVVDNEGNTPLHNACVCYGVSSLWSVQYLLEGNCDPNMKNNAGLTPIQVTPPGSSDIIRELVRHGANLKVFDNNGNTPLHNACKQKVTSSVRSSKLGCSSRQSVLCLLKVGKCDPNIKNKAGLTPIQVASLGSSDIMRELIKHGANPNVVDNNGNTPLHIACKYGMFRSVVCLLEGKCDSNIKNKAGLTPLQVAASNISRDQEPSAFLEQLVQHGANPNVVDSDGNTPLHKACKYEKLESVKCLLKKGKCDSNIRNMAGLTPLQLAAFNISQWNEPLDILEQLVQHGANPNVVVDNDGNTSLHKACEYCNLESVKHFLDVGKCDPNIKNKAGLTPIQVTSPDFPDIIRELIRHGARSTDAYQAFGNVLKKPKPLQPPVKVFIVGNPSTGKSTLTESLKNEASQFRGRFLKVTGVDAKTAGINPHEFNSKKYGSVTFYDFAGQRAYYSSHAAVLRNSIQTSPIFIIVIDLLDDNEVIIKDLTFWLSFLSNQICSLENKPHVIVVGSHADALSSKGEQAEKKMSRAIKSLPPISDFILVEAIPLDCRYPSSSGMTKLHQCLRQSCDALRIHHTINFNAHCFFIYLLDNFRTLISMTVKEIKTKIELNSDLESNVTQLMSFIPTTLQSLCIILDELNDRGHILYLKDHSNDENSWVIIDKAALLSEVTGTIFAPADFKQHCTLASSTGVVPLSKLSSHFPKHNIKMIVAFLYHLEFCREITDPEARSLIIKHHQSGNSATQHSDTELYFLFPGLIRLEAPEGIWEPNIRFSNYFGWALQTQSHQFFTTRLLQVLILRLAFSFALAPDPKDVKSEVPAFQRKCSIWKSGIFWGDRFGVEALVEMLPSNDTMVLLIRSYDSNLTNLLLLRSKLIQRILGVACEVCSRVNSVELFIDSSECNRYPFTLANCNTRSMQEIAKAALEETSHPAVVSSTGKTLQLLEDLLIYEPYAGLGLSFLKDFLSSSPAERKLPDEFLSMIAKRIPRSLGHEIVERLLKENTSSDDILIALKNWRDKRKATYQNLKEILDQMSVFTGRNLLKLAGVDICVLERPQDESLEVDTELSLKQVLTDNELVTDGVSLDLVSVTTALTDLLQWHKLGLHLGIRKIKLDEIRLDYDKFGQSRQKSEMIDLWLRTDKDASWEKLCAALEQMGEFTIADEIRKQYISCVSLLN